MHKVLKVPMLHIPLHLYVGEKGLKLFKRDIKTAGANNIEDISSRSVGLHFSNHVYIEDIKDRRTVYHEMIHWIDWLFDDYLNANKELEFRAYMGSYMIEKVLGDK